MAGVFLFGDMEFNRGVSECYYRPLVRTLIYKRTHKGDPDASGWFGLRDCMGRVRNMDFDCVIGIGGAGSDAQLSGIAGKLNWIGVGAHKVPSNGRGPVVWFDHFVLFDELGEELWKLAPKLARRMYASPGPRFKIDIDLSPAEKQEIQKILEIAKKKVASSRPPGMPTVKKNRRCRICRHDAAQ